VIIDELQNVKKRERKGGRERSNRRKARKRRM
jgi:hypothetical protein